MCAQGILSAFGPACDRFRLRGLRTLCPGAWRGETPSLSLPLFLDMIMNMMLHLFPRHPRGGVSVFVALIPDAGIGAGIAIDTGMELGVEREDGARLLPRARMRLRARSFSLALFIISCRRSS